MASEWKPALIGTLAVIGFIWFLVAFNFVAGFFQARMEREAEQERIAQLQEEMPENLSRATQIIASEGSVDEARALLEGVHEVAPESPELAKLLTDLEDLEAEKMETTLLARVESATVTELARIYSELADLRPDNQDYGRLSLRYHREAGELERHQAAEEANQRRRAAAKLELIDWHWGAEHSYAIAEGRVKNITSQPLRNVEAVVTWTDRSDQLITSDSALIEFNPVMPGQVSPFRVMARHNPAMSSASLTFKTLFGGSIPWIKE